jgi:mRNA interferase MazF
MIGSQYKIGVTMKRGEVHWVKFALPDKRRPALILTRNSAILLLSRVTVAPITRAIRDIPSDRSTLNARR